MEGLECVLITRSCSDTRSLKFISCHVSEGLRDFNKFSSKDIVISCFDSSDKGSDLVGRSLHCGPIEKSFKYVIVGGGVIAKYAAREFAK